MKKTFGIIAILGAALLLVSVCGCVSSSSPIPESVASASASASVSPTPTVTASAPQVPAAMPTATPRPCDHVEIVIAHNMSTPCNTCSEMSGFLGAYYQKDPYVSIVMQNASSNSVIGSVRETGQVKTFTWGNYPAIEAWTDSVLTCTA